MPFGFCLTFDIQNESGLNIRIIIKESQLPFGFCLTFDITTTSIKRTIEPVQSQLPFGFCLTFDRSFKNVGSRPVQGVSIAFRLLSHFRPSQRLRLRLRLRRSLNCLSAFVSLSTSTLIVSSTVSGMCLNCLSAFVSLSTSTWTGSAVRSRIRTCLNCLSAFVSLSTASDGRTDWVGDAASQLPFGFCLTFDQLSTTSAPTTVLRLSQLPFGFCLTFDSPRTSSRHSWGPASKSQLPFGFCLTFDPRRCPRRCQWLPPVSIAFRLLSHFRLSRRKTICRTSEWWSQLPFGFCLTFDPSRAASRRRKWTQMSQLPFGFCLTFDKIGRFYLTRRTREESQLPFGFCLTFDPLRRRSMPPSREPVGVSIAFRLLSHFRP